MRYILDIKHPKRQARPFSALRAAFLQDNALTHLDCGETAARSTLAGGLVSTDKSAVRPCYVLKFGTLSIPHIV